MIISERISKLLEEKQMSQNAFAKKEMYEVCGGAEDDRRVGGILWEKKQM